MQVSRKRGSVTLKKGVVQWTGGFMMTLGEFHVEEEREFHDGARS